jgi:hypothetical protein
MWAFSYLAASRDGGGEEAWWCQCNVVVCHSLTSEADTEGSKPSASVATAFKTHRTSTVVINGSTASFLNSLSQPTVHEHTCGIPVGGGRCGFPANRYFVVWHSKRSKSGNFESSSVRGDNVQRYWCGCLKLCCFVDPVVSSIFS